MDFLGIALQEDIEEKELYIVNMDTKSRMGNSGQRDSNLNLVFTSKEIIDVTNYEQMKDTWRNDHYPIKL